MTKKLDLTLTSDKFVDWFKLIAFADDKLNVAKMMISRLDRAENTLGNGENAGYQNFFFSLSVFQSLLFIGC